MQRYNYQQKLSHAEIEKIEITLGELMEEFGYYCDNKYTRIKVLFNNISLVNTKVKLFAGRVLRRL